MAGQKQHKWLWAAVVFLVLIGVAAVLRRVLALAAGPGTGPTAETDLNFAPHPVLTLVHILPAFFFIVLSPLQFVKRLRNRVPKVHRWMGRMLVVLGFVIGTTAGVMSFKMAVGGINEIAATVLFDSLFLFFLIRGYAAARKRDFAAHREWMIRMFGVALGVATVRPIMGVFFATRRLTHLTPHDFFGIAFWIGFTITLIGAESWINYTRKPRSARVRAEMTREVREPLTRAT